MFDAAASKIFVSKLQGFRTICRTTQCSIMTSPLDVYRQKGSVCPIKLKKIIEGEDHVEYKKEFTSILEKDPQFHRTFDRPTLQEAREVNHKRWKQLVKYNFVDDPYMERDKFLALSEVLETYDQGLSARLSLHANVFTSAIMSMGTEKHQELLEKARKNQIVGCFCLTELSHGSNTQEVQTLATYDNGSFVFNSPTDGSIKVWAGNLAMSATHAVVFCQLVTENQKRGLHAFVLQVRDEKTFKSLPGITIGDMGEKPGAWNGVENGWMHFKNHRAPLSTLLNKGVEVTNDGKYISSYKSVGERQSVSLGALSVGRIGIIGKGMLACGLASTIAIRYSAVRRQFGPPGKEEVPVLEYPLQQHRLFPYLAANIAIRVFQKKFLDFFTEYMMRMMSGEKSEELVEFSKEVHCLSSAAKPVSTWLGVEALGEARRACGGHGYLHASRLNTLRDDFDPSQTFEGENNILLQQTSNILMAKSKSGTLTTPMKSFTFLRTPIRPVGSSAGLSGRPIEDILSAYQWLINHLITSSVNDYEKEKTKGSFTSRNNTQIYRAHPLSIAYAEHTIISWFKEFVDEVEDKKYAQVLNNVCLLYAVFSLEKHLATLYIGGYCTGSAFGEGLRDLRKATESALYPEIMVLVDATSPSDFLLHSALGAGDGKAYDHLMEEFRSREYEKCRPTWWKDLSDFLNERNLNSKL